MLWITKAEELETRYLALQFIAGLLPQESSIESGGHIMIHRLKVGILTLVLAAACLALQGCDEQDQSILPLGAGEKAGGPKYVELKTTKGSIVLELDEEKAPVTVANFLRYVKEGFYDGTIFHRVIPRFVIQGGGFTPDMTKKEIHETIINESSNGLKNARGSVAMARTRKPDSASSQFFINLFNNYRLDYAGENRPGYTVFGKVIDGMPVVDAIAQVKRKDVGMFSDVPVEPIVIESARIVKGK
jgi:peptidyl-prolyl cis-trans isomerase A (cyclophilin A)